MSRDIVDEIDALIDDQLAAGEDGMARRAAAASDRRCWHCGRAWHGLAITARMEEMRREYEIRTQRRIFATLMAGEVGEADYAESAILDDYRYADDTSDILCPGSEFIGPMPATMRRYECQCANCRAMRSYARIRDRALQDSIVGEPIGYTERFASNPESPWVRYSPGGLIGPRRWWRLDLTQYSAEDNIVVNLDHAEITDFGRTFLRRTHTLTIQAGEGFDRYQAIIRLYEDEDRNVFREEWELDNDRHDSGRRTAIEIHANRPDDCGGRLVWHELDGPNGNYLHSRAVEPATTLPNMLDQLRVSFLLTNRYRAPGWIRDELGASFDRLVETLGVPGFLTRAINAARSGAPYGAVYEPVDGDRVGVEIGGDTVVGTVRNVDTTDGTTTFDFNPDLGWQPFGTISPDTDAFITETTEPIFDEPARANRAARRGQPEPHEPFWARIRPGRRRGHP